MSTMTKRIFAASLKKMMGKRPLDKITIKDIVEDCEVNRQTFYYHFQDIYGLLGWIYKTEALGAIEDCKTYATWQQGFLQIFRYVEENKMFCQNTYRSLGREHLESFLYDVVFSLLIDVVDELSEGADISQEHKNFIAKFYTYAFIGLLLEWLQEGIKSSPEQIVENLKRLIDGDIKRAIEKFSC